MLLWILLACAGGTAPQSPSPEKTVQVKVPETIEVELPSPKLGTPRFTTVPLKKSSGTQYAIDTLTEVVMQHGRDPTNPWAIGHGLVAMGHPLTLTNNIDAVQWLFDQYAERYLDDGVWRIRFPTRKGATRIEPHTDLLLKAMSDAGTDPATRVEVDGHTHTVADLYHSSLRETWINPSSGSTSFKTPNDIPWSLFGLASWSAEKTEWTSQAGKKSSLDALTDHTMTILGKETAFIARAKEVNGGFQKRGQGIFQYTCGGAHLLQGVAHATLRGFGSSSNPSRLKEQLHLLLYRFPIELQQIDDGEKQHPDFKLQLRIQRLKLTGHTLETLYRISATDMIGEPDRKALEQVAAEVVKSVVLLQEIGAFAQIKSIRAAQEQLYLDLVGDAAHTLRGLRIATGVGAVYY